MSFFDLGFRLRAPGDLSDDELDKTLDSLYARVTGQEKAQLVQLQSISNALSSVAFPTYLAAGGTVGTEGPSQKLKQIVRTYFQSELDVDVELIPEVISPNLFKLQKAFKFPFFFSRTTRRTYSCSATSGR